MTSIPVLAPFMDAEDVAGCRRRLHRALDHLDAGIARSEIVPYADREKFVTTHRGVSVAVTIPRRRGNVALTVEGDPEFRDFSLREPQLSDRSNVVDGSVSSLRAYSARMRTVLDWTIPGQPVRSEEYLTLFRHLEMVGGDFVQHIIHVIAHKEGDSHAKVADWLHSHDLEMTTGRPYRDASIRYTQANAKALDLLKADGTDMLTRSLPGCAMLRIVAGDHVLGPVEVAIARRDHDVMESMRGAARFAQAASILEQRKAGS